MTADPNELWAEIVTLAAERAALHEKIDVDLDALPAEPPAEAIDAHLQRCSDHYDKLISLGEQIGVVIDQLAERSVTAEIGDYLAITYGGRS